MGEQRQLHPRETMDDITEVSSTASIERKNTFMITKSTEADPRPCSRQSSAVL